jgi:hypothetical protein
MVVLPYNSLIHYKSICHGQRMIAVAPVIVDNNRCLVYVPLLIKMNFSHCELNISSAIFKYITNTQETYIMYLFRFTSSLFICVALLFIL